MADAGPGAWLRQGAALALALGALWALVTFPVGRLPLLAGAAAWVVLLWRRPDLWVLGVPVVVAGLDLAFWSGRLLWDAWDTFLALTVAVLLWRRRPSLSAFGRIGGIAVVWVSVAWAVAMVRGTLATEPPSDPGAFLGYLGALNSLRVAKGLGWALALSFFLPEARQARRCFAAGIVGGLALVSAVVVWERLVFTGPYNTEARFRVSAMFSEVHTGGGAVETFFALTFPLAVVWGLGAPSIRTRAFALVVCIAGVYGMVVTYARGGVLALGVSIVVLVGMTLRAGRQRLRAGAMLLLVGVMTATLGSGHLRERLGDTWRDLAARVAHWEGAVGLMNGWTERVLGVGLGTFPRRYLGRHGPEAGLGAYRLVDETGERFLRLSGGRDVYVVQRLGSVPPGPWRLTLRVRSLGDRAQVQALVCRNNFLYSMGCSAVGFSAAGQGEAWVTHTAEIGPPSGSSPGWLRRAPLVFALFDPVYGTTVDVDDVQIRDAKGRQILRNGGFTAGHDRWFFLSDNHLPWHVDNLWVQLYFELGLVGVVSFFFLATVAGVRSWGAAREGDVLAAGMLASGAGVLTVGLFNSPFDDPRIALLLFMTIFLSMQRSRPPCPGG